MSVLESTNLRDLLRVRDNEDDGRDALAGLTLSAVLGCERPRRPSRTLLDIIKDEESGAAYRGLVPPTESPSNKNPWRSFASRLRLGRAGAAFSSSSTHPNDCDYSIEACDIRISSPVLVDRGSFTRNPSFTSPGNSTGNSNHTTTSPSSGIIIPEVTTSSTITSAVNPISPAEEQRLAREETGLNSIISLNTTVGSVENSSREVTNVVASTLELELELEAEAEEVAVPPRVSLMALLEETDWNNAGAGESMDMDADGLALAVGEVKKEDGLEVEDCGVREFVCCICMIRHKGAAFIPCGHTFCRICSRELWVNRGNCPLCNRYILEILDIF